MSYNWRVSHQRTTEGLNVLAIEQWADSGLGRFEQAVYIPPWGLDSFVEKVTRLAEQVRSEHAARTGDAFGGKAGE